MCHAQINIDYTGRRAGVRVLDTEYDARLQAQGHSMNSTHVASHYCSVSGGCAVKRIDCNRMPSLPRPGKQ